MRVICQTTGVVPAGPGVVPTERLASSAMDLPRGRTAQIDVVLDGSLTSTGGGVQSTCTLVRDGDRVIVVDPGMATGAEAILDPLAALGVRPEDVTDVVLSHHHPDHTLYAGLFPKAAVHDHWAIYRGTDWEDSECDGRVLSPSVQLARTPGHTAEDLALIAGTPDGVVVTTHSWFHADSTVEDEDPEDLEQLRTSRRQILAVADLIIPGHGPAFRPSDSTPR
jgi:glyoxylase-like metal-dependent hydrolase (beta-lactamase superfamily II)